MDQSAEQLATGRTRGDQQLVMSVEQSHLTGRATTA